MNFLNKVADIMILNILFILFSIPVITIGASYTAAYYVAIKMVRDEETYILKSFWKSFKENFVQSTILWLIILVMAGVLIGDYRLILYSGVEFAYWMRIAILIVTVVILLGVSYIFPMQSRYSNTVKNTFKNSFLTALSHLPTSFLIVVIYAVPVVILYYIPQAFAVLFLLSFGLIIYAKSFFIRKIFDKYEEKMEEANGEKEEAGSGIFAESERLEKEIDLEKANSK
jgi:uncharacterized membrane protein YesL